MVVMREREGGNGEKKEGRRTGESRKKNEGKKERSLDRERESLSTAAAAAPCYRCSFLFLSLKRDLFPSTTTIIMQESWLSSTLDLFWPILNEIRCGLSRRPSR